MDFPAKCAVLVPAFSTIEPEVQDVLLELARRGYAVRTLRGSSQIDLARSTLATEALRDGFAETMWIDADVVFDPNDVDRLRRHGLPFTAGLYVKKNCSGFACKFKPGTKDVTFGKGGGLLEVEYVGMGFTHVRRVVYERMQSELKLPTCTGGYEGKTVVPYFIPKCVPNGDGLDYLSEDFSYCHRATMVGYPPRADTTIRLEHVGRKRYSWDDLVVREKIETLQVS